MKVHSEHPGVKCSLSYILPQDARRADILRKINDFGNQSRHLIPKAIELLDENLTSIERHHYSIDLRNKAERMWRLTILLSPDDPEFEATLMWADAQGEELEMETIDRIQKSFEQSGYPELSSKEQFLLNHAKKRIEARIQPKAIYKVFASEEHLRSVWVNLSIKVVHSYPAYTLLTASEGTIGKIKRSFPVELLEPEPNLEESVMADKRDWVIYSSIPLSENWIENIRNIDSSIDILEVLERYQIVISIFSQDTLERIKKLEGVSKIISYQPTINVRTEYLEKLGQEVTEEAIAEALAAVSNLSSISNSNIPIPGILISYFFKENDRDIAANELEATGVRIVSKPSPITLVLDVCNTSCPIDAFEIIKKQIGLRVLEEKIIDILSNNKARNVIGTNVIPSNPVPNSNSLSLTGEEEIIAIADTGLDTGNPETIHLDIRGRAEIKSYPIQPEYDSVVDNPGGDNGGADRYSGHETHIAGSALGNGQQAINMNISPIKGMAIKAKLYFQAIEQAATWKKSRTLDFYIPTFKRFPPSTAEPGLYGRPQDLGVLFEDAYKKKGKNMLYFLGNWRRK